MSFTGRLGTVNSQLGQIELGIGDSSNLNQVISQTIDFVQEARGDSHRYEANQSLAFAQVASAVVARAASASNTLALVQSATQGTVFSKSVSDTLALSQLAIGGIQLGRNVSQSLGLIQTVSVLGPIYVTVEQGLGLVQTAGVQGPIYQEIHDHLNLVQVTSQTEIYVTAGNVLNFQQKAGRVIPVSVSQSIAFTQLGERSNKIVHTLSLVQTVTVGKGGDVDQELDLVQSATVEGLFGRSIADTLGLFQSVTYYIDRGCTRFQYTPFVGSVSDPDFTPPSTTAPTLGSHRLRLTYPYVSPSVTVNLPNPSFGDKDRLNFNRINSETRGGTLIVFADPKWPKTQTLALQIDNLNPNQAADMIAFLRTTLGQEIGLLDWENRQWRGIITTPDARMTHVGRHDRSIAFEFQGELV